MVVTSTGSMWCDARRATEATGCRGLRPEPPGAATAREPALGRSGRRRRFRRDRRERADARRARPVGSGCGPCRMVAPVLERVAADEAGRLKVVKVDVDSAPRTAARYRASSIPTLLLLQRGREVARQVGAVPEPVLRRWIKDQLAGLVQEKLAGPGRRTTERRWRSPAGALAKLMEWTCGPWPGCRSTQSSEWPWHGPAHRRSLCTRPRGVGGVMKARDVMTSPVITLQPDTPVPAAAALLQLARLHFCTCPRRRRTDRRDRGRGRPGPTPVVPDWWVVQQEPDPTVDQVMTPTPAVMHPEDDLADVVAVMLDSSIRSIPIVDDRDVVGIITRHDVLRVVARRQLISRRGNGTTVRWSPLELTCGATLPGARCRRARPVRPSSSGCTRRVDPFTAASSLVRSPWAVTASAGRTAGPRRKVLSRSPLPPRILRRAGFRRCGVTVRSVGHAVRFVRCRGAGVVHELERSASTTSGTPIAPSRFSGGRLRSFTPSWITSPRIASRASRCEPASRTGVPGAALTPTESAEMSASSTSTTPVMARIPWSTSSMVTPRVVFSMCIPRRDPLIAGPVDQRCERCRRGCRRRSASAVEVRALTATSVDQLTRIPPDRLSPVTTSATRVPACPTSAIPNSVLRDAEMPVTGRSELGPVTSTPFAPFPSASTPISVVAGRHAARARRPPSPIRSRPPAARPGAVELADRCCCAAWPCAPA